MWEFPVFPWGCIHNFSSIQELLKALPIFLSRCREYFNTAAFTVNTVGAFGNAGRNVLIGPGLKNIDFGAIKTFTVKERYKVQFRAEAFNIFNHANFNNPSANVSASTFGTITSAGAPRVLQLALKAMF